MISISVPFLLFIYFPISPVCGDADKIRPKASYTLFFPKKTADTSFAPVSAIRAVQYALAQLLQSSGFLFNSIPDNRKDIGHFCLVILS